LVTGSMSSPVSLRDARFVVPSAFSCCVSLTFLSFQATPSVNPGLPFSRKKESTKKNARSWISHLENQLEEIEQQEKLLEGIRSNWQQAQDEILRFEHWCAGWRDKLD